MWMNYLATLFIVTSVAGRELRDRQSNTTTIASRVEDGIQTECKTCPYELCTNHAAYEYNAYMTLTCWTYGDVIVDTKSASITFCCPISGSLTSLTVFGSRPQMDVMSLNGTSSNIREIVSQEYV